MFLPPSQRVYTAVFLSYSSLHKSDGILCCIPTTQTLQVYFLLFHEHNYSDCVFTLNTVPEHILCRHRWRNEAAAAAALLTCCFHHTASVCVDSLTSCCKAYDHWCSLSLCYLLVFSAKSCHATRMLVSGWPAGV